MMNVCRVLCIVPIPLYMPYIDFIPYILLYIPLYIVYLPDTQHIEHSYVEYV